MNPPLSAPPDTTAAVTPAANPAPGTGDDSPLRLFGWYMVFVGILHFVAPRRWDRMTALAFPESTRDWTYRIGLSETLQGVLLARPRTRALGAAAAVVQALWLIRRFFALRAARHAEGA